MASTINQRNCLVSLATVRTVQAHLHLNPFHRASGEASFSPNKDHAKRYKKELENEAEAKRKTLKADGADIARAYACIQIGLAGTSKKVRACAYLSDANIETMVTGFGHKAVGGRPPESKYSDGAVFKAREAAEKKLKGIGNVLGELTIFTGASYVERYDILLVAIAMANESMRSSLAVTHGFDTRLDPGRFSVNAEHLRVFRKIWPVNARVPRLAQFKTTGQIGRLVPGIPSVDPVIKQKADQAARTALSIPSDLPTSALKPSKRKSLAEDTLDMGPSWKCLKMAGGLFTHDTLTAHKEANTQIPDKTAAQLMSTGKPLDSMDVQASAAVKPSDSINAQASATAKPSDSMEAQPSAAAKPSDSMEAQPSAAAKLFDSIDAQVSAAAKPSDSMEAQPSAAAKLFDNIDAQVSAAAKPSDSMEAQPSAAAKPSDSMEAQPSAAGKLSDSIDTQASAAAKPSDSMDA